MHFEERSDAARARKIGRWLGQEYDHDNRQNTSTDRARAWPGGCLGRVRARIKIFSIQRCYEKCSETTI